MYTVFWDRRGILLVDFLTRCETVNAGRYYETLQILRWATEYRQRGMLSAGVVLLHDNARPHTARRSTYLPAEVQLGGVNHLTYSPDIGPSDLYFLLPLKKFLFDQRQRFQNEREVELSVTQ